MFNFDDALIQWLIAQDESAFAVFYESSVDIFHRYMRWHYFLSQAEIDDVLSDFYLKCWKWLPSYNTDYKLETYVWTILKNHVKDYFKKRKSIQLKDEHASDPSLVDDWEYEMMETLQKEYDYESICTVMKELDDDSYDVIHLRYIEEMWYDMMSETLWISQDALRQRLSRALKKVKDRIGKIR